MSARLSMKDRELLRRVMVGIHEDAELGDLDLAVLNDLSVFDTVEQGDGGELLAALDKILSLAENDAALSNLLGVPPHSLFCPEGLSARRWIFAMRNRVAEIVADPTVVPDYPHEDVSGFEPPRVSRWVPTDVTDAAIETVRARLDAWMSEPAGSTWFRHHYLVDLGAQAGQVAPVVGVGLGAEVTWEQSVPTQFVSLGVERQVSQAGPSPTIERDLRTWRIVFARPELPLDTTVRQRFPDLCHLFGGYYGQPFDDQHGWPIHLTARVMRRTSGHARERMRDQLTELLTIRDDDELVASVGHLGSYCLPYFMRHWVDRLLWKLDALDWGEPPLPPSATR